MGFLGHPILSLLRKLIVLSKKAEGGNCSDQKEKRRPGLVALGIAGFNLATCKTVQDEISPKSRKISVWNNIVSLGMPKAFQLDATNTKSGVFKAK